MLPSSETFEAVVFDCYGTLIDRDQGVRDYVAPILAQSRRGRVTAEQWLARWRKIERDLRRPYRPYADVLARSYDATMQHFELEAFVDAGAGMARAVSDWAPFAEATRALRQVARRRRVAIVADADRGMLADSAGRLQAPVSCLVTAEEVAAYAPEPAALRLVLERLQVAPQAVLHVAAAGGLTLEAARALGMRTCCVVRDASAATAPAAGADETVGSLAQLVERLAPT